MLITKAEMAGMRTMRALAVARNFMVNVKGRYALMRIKGLA